LTPQGSRSTTLEVDTLTIDPAGAHDLQHSKWTHLQLTPQGLNSTIYNTRGEHTYNRPHRGSRSTTLEVDTLTIDPTGAQFQGLQHSRWTHLQLTPQGSRSTTLEADTLTIDPTGAHDLQHSKWTHLQLTPQGLNSTIYNTRGGHTYNRPHRGSRSTTLEVDTYK
jgi:hypothetical protein